MARGRFLPRRCRRKPNKAPEPPRAGAARPTAGWQLLLPRLDDSDAAEKILEALAGRYAVTTAREDVDVVRVVVDDAVDPDEAVIRLASVLDGIDRGWESRLGWPRTAMRS